jgi:predicted DNA-binding transcriptional regulator YafY
LSFSLKFARIEQTDRPDPAGWVRLVIRFQTMQEACEHLLGFGLQAEALEPPELRESITAGAAQVLEFYARPDTNL